MIKLSLNTLSLNEINGNSGISVFVGYGETVDDLMEFDLENYIYGLCSTMEGEE